MRCKQTSNRRVARSLSILVMLAGMATGGRAWAQDLLPKAPPQSGPIVLVGGVVHPVSGPAIPDGVVYFSDGVLRGVMDKEAWIKAQAQVLWAAPPTIIDVAGKHVYPGLVAPFTQLGLTEIQAVDATNDLRETGGITPEVRSVIAVNPDSTLLPVTRRNGVLTAGVFPSSAGGGGFAGRAGVIRLDGWTTPEMTIEDDAGVVLEWPTVRPINAWWMATSEEEQRTKIREGLARIRTTIETARAYAVQRAMDASTPVDLRWEAMRELFVMPKDVEERGGAGASDQVNTSARGVQKPLFVLAQDADQIESAVAFCVEQNLRCVVVGGREADLCAPLLIKHGVMVIVRGVQNMPRRDDSAYDEAFALPTRLAEAGVAFAIASNDDTAHERNLPYNAATAVAFGLSEERAMASITLDAARALGVGDELGSLEVGKRATLIVTTGSPLEVTSDVAMAFIDGRMIDLSSKQTQLAEKYLERYRQMGILPRPQVVPQPAPQAGGAAPKAGEKPKMDLSQ
jgi:imidazolonepropionase-like amidohydrolase